MKKLPKIWDPYADVKLSILPNGLNIYSAYWNRPWMHVRFCVHSGSLDDPVGKEGLAHFVEHMISERPGRLSLKKIQRHLEKSGGGANLGTTNLYRTNFYFEVPLVKRILMEGLEIYGKILQLPLEEKLVSHERQIIQHEFKRSYPIRIKYDLAIMPYSVAFNGTPLADAKLTLGNPETIAIIQYSDLVDFYRSHYNAKNMCIIAAGGMSHSDFMEIIKGTVISELTSGIKKEMPAALTTLPFPQSNEKIISISELFPGVKLDDVPAMASMILIAQIPGCFQRKAVSLLWNVLKEVFYEQLREKTGSTYHSELYWEYHQTFYTFRIEIFLDLGKMEKIKDIVLAKALKTARDIRRFNRQKNCLVNSYIINDMDMETFCKNVEADIVKFGKVLNSFDEMTLCDQLLYDDYCSLLDYLADSRRWWRMIETP